MNPKDWFKLKPKQDTVIHIPVNTPPGTVILVDDLNQQVIVEESTPDISKVYLPPCPATHILVCVCSSCNHVSACPMEKMCRMEDCNIFIRACQNYTNQTDTNLEDKRIIFKSGGQWNGDTFCFKGKKENNAEKERSRG